VGEHEVSPRLFPAAAAWSRDLGFHHLVTLLSSKSGRYYRAIFGILNRALGRSAFRRHCPSSAATSGSLCDGVDLQDR